MSKLVNISHGQQRSFQIFLNLLHYLPSSHVNQWNNNENSSQKEFFHRTTNCKIFKIAILIVHWDPMKRYTLLIYNKSMANVPGKKYFERSETRFVQTQEVAMSLLKKLVQSYKHQWKRKNYPTLGNMLVSFVDGQTW